MSTKREFRFVKEMRATGSAAKPKLVGYAAIFNSPSQDLGGFVEVIRPGAFSRCLQNSPDVRALFNHDESQILGRTKSGTLRLSEDSKGLRCEIDLPDTSVGKNLYESVKRGDISEMSFGFTAVDENWVPNPAGKPANLRELYDVDVFDCSPVTYPAYQGTSVNARSLWPDGKPEHMEFRNLARTMKNHSAPVANDTAERRKRAADLLAEIQKEEIERQQQVLKAALL